jgi:hypothetical protein
VKHPALVLLLAVSLAGCSSPFVLLPGGELKGSVAGTPASWEFTDEVDKIQLETRPGEPYSVNIWVTALDESLYVHAGTNQSTWVQNMQEDPNVRLQVGESIYELASVRVEAQGEFDRFSDAYEKKYGRRPGNEIVGEVYLFRLGPR